MDRLQNAPGPFEALACFDGRLMAAAQARIPVTDEGLLRGDGVFEVARLYAGRPFALDEHFARLERSAANLRLDVDLGAFRDDVTALLAAAPPADGCLRVVATRGGHRLALTEPLPSEAQSLRLGCVTYAPTRVLDAVKSLSYAANMQASRLARERGFDVALLVTPLGRVLEAPTASFFWVADDELRTPPLDDHILASITRGRVIELTGAREEPCDRDALERLEEAFLVSTTREVTAVAAIDDRRLPAPGPVTTDAAERLRGRIEAELEAAKSEA